MACCKSDTDLEHNLHLCCECKHESGWSGENPYCNLCWGGHLGDSDVPQQLMYCRWEAR